jgi:hypothetical protein
MRLKFARQLRERRQQKRGFLLLARSRVVLGVNYRQRTI